MSSYSCAHPLDEVVSPHTTSAFTEGMGEAGDGKASRGVGCMLAMGLELQWIPAITLCVTFFSLLFSVSLRTVRWPPFVPTKSSG